MTTENINGKNAARKAAKVVADNAKNRAAKVANEAAEVERQKAEDLENAEILKRILEQEAKDRMSSIGHEVAQLNYVLNGAPAPEPAPVVEPEPVVEEPPVTESTPKVVEETVVPTPASEPAPVAVEVLAVDPSVELQRKLDQSDKEKEVLQRKLEDCEKSKEEKPAPAVSPTPPTNTQPSITQRANPFNWGWLAWLLAIIGFILGWTVFGEWLEIQSQPSLWDWVAWLFSPVSAGVGFFGFGLIGHFIAEKLNRPVVA